ncbi:stealth family protein [Arthrobacter sp. I2-34]|uniref:Stealth family protein n=1 Tax=Arthrobacter hankyongi TaxID=2904801 RepID=A0ABS9L6F4_9MICC|nr:stealth family protein [Arthrobacter hankyongi]MCG2622254.1 stealth family protein [Arthrobacter hankyongi]
MIAEVRGWAARTLPRPMVRTLFNLAYGRTGMQRGLKKAVDHTRLRVQHTGLTEGEAAVSVAGGLLPARSVPRFSAAQAIVDNRALVAGALEAAGIAFRDETLPGGAPTLGIAPERLQQAVEAVAQAAEGRAVYLLSSAGDGPHPVADAKPVPDAPLTFFEALEAGGLVLADQRHGCVVSPAAGPGRSLPWYSDVTFPIDAVYTWVDGTDPAWAARKAEAWRQAVAAGAGGSRYSEYSANDARFRSHDELRFSLRSLDYFAPWINHVYLVTAGQIPDWLDRDNPRITLVHHREIFADPGVLPTFNSHAIEAQLHRIRGLSEHFLYLNDDVFFGRHVDPELFFLGNGLTRMYLSSKTVDFGPDNPADLPVDSAVRRNRALLEQAFGRTIAYKFQHVAHPERVSTLAGIERQFPEQIRATTSAKFRTPEDISVASALAHYYGYLSGTTVPGRLSYRYCDISQPSAQGKLLRLLRDRNADVFCLNEVDSSGLDPEDLDRMVQDFLTEYFPVPSSFEVQA